MTKELLEIVEEYRNDGIIITEEETEDVYSLCVRKMDIGRVKDKEKYMPVLFRSELRNYLFRRAVNATTMLGGMAYV